MALHSTSIAPLRAGVLSSLGTPHLLWLHDYPDPILIDDGRFRRRAHVHAASVSVADEHDRPLRCMALTVPKKLGLGTLMPHAFARLLLGYQACRLISCYRIDPARGAARGKLAAPFCIGKYWTRKPRKSPNMRIGRRVVLGSCRWSTACVLVLIRAAPVALFIFALLLPANAQFWGNSWGGRQQQQYNPYARQPYNPYGGCGGNRKWGNGDYRKWGSFPRQREQQRKRPREVEKEQTPDYSRAPPATPREDATIKVVVMGDANADWLAFGLEDAFSEKP